MAEHLIFHDCSTGVKEGAQEHWERKHARIERLLKHFPTDQRHLRLTLRRQADRYQAHCVLILPTGTLVAETDAPSFLDVLDGVCDRLVAEIQRHKAMVRHDSTRRQTGRGSLVRQRVAPARRR